MPPPYACNLRLEQPAVAWPSTAPSGRARCDGRIGALAARLHAVHAGVAHVARRGAARTRTLRRTNAPIPARR